MTQLFVTTYAVGNEHGFGMGKWFDLSQFENAKEFFKSVKEYAVNILGDKDPEPCFADYEEMPFSIYSECMGETDINSAIYFANLSAEEQNQLKDYLAYRGMTDGETLEQIHEECESRFYCQADSIKDFVIDYLTEIGMIEPDSPIFTYIDYQRYWDYELSCDFVQLGDRFYRID